MHAVIVAVICLTDSRKWGTFGHHAARVGSDSTQHDPKNQVSFMDKHCIFSQWLFYPLFFLNFCFRFGLGYAEL